MNTTLRAFTAYAFPFALYMFLHSGLNPRAKLLAILIGLSYGLVLAAAVFFLYTHLSLFAQVFLSLVLASSILGLCTGCVSLSVYSSSAIFVSDWERLDMPPEKAVELVAYGPPPGGESWNPDVFIKTSDGNIDYYDCIRHSPPWCSMQWLKTASIPEKPLEPPGGSLAAALGALVSANCSGPSGDGSGSMPGDSGSARRTQVGRKRRGRARDYVLCGAFAGRTRWSSVAHLPKEHRCVVSTQLLVDGSRYLPAIVLQATSHPAAPAHRKRRPARRFACSVLRLGPRPVRQS